MSFNKKLFLIIIILSFFLFAQVSFAQTNDNLTSDNNLGNDDSGILNDNNPKNKTILIISDNPGTNIIDSASDEIYNQDKLSGFNIVLRSGDQIKDMNEDELHALFSGSDAFIGEWISTDVDAVLTNLLGNYPELSHKELFLILEPPSGNVNSESSSIKLIRNNTINYEKIFASYSDEKLVDYFKNTKRGTDFNDVNNAEVYVFAAGTEPGRASVSINGVRDDNAFNTTVKNTVSYYSKDITSIMKDSNEISLILNKGMFTALQQIIVVTKKVKEEPKNDTPAKPADNPAAPAVNKQATKIVAKKKTFKAKTKVKKYTITLKAGKKAVKKVWVTLKIKGKTFKAKTNAKGKAVFKIKKLTKKGTYKAKISFKGNANYKASSKTVKIKIK